MVIIEFLGPIDSENLELDISSLKELSNYMLSNDNLKEWAINSAVAINNKIVTDINTKLEDGDRVSILPPVCGG